MSADYIYRFEQLLGRKPNLQDEARLLRIKDILNIGDNDAFWDILIAMEYQRSYYEDIPNKIEQSASAILEKLSLSAKQEVALAQATLAESVVAQAKELSTREHILTWLLWGSIALILTIMYGSLMLWIGYGLGAGKVQELHAIVRMPVGFILSGILLCGGIYLGIYAAKAYAVEDKNLCVIILEKSLISCCNRLYFLLFIIKKGRVV